MADNQSKKRKKQKTGDSNVVTPVLPSPLSPTVFAETTIEKYTAAHQASGPYKHVVIKDLCDDSRMRLIHGEITNNMKANFKETDLFKVFQTGDLAALDKKLIAKMPNLMSLRQSIYSPEFRDMVSRITGLNDLTDRVDCSANAYANSCHLLCHDDVIGTRRVSYIIYLTDPDDPWVVTDGGAVELYPIIEESVVDRGEEHGGRQGVPAAAPTTSLLPTYNTMLIFSVQPGRSYHSVQEVYSKDKPRLSISGWYHGPDAPKGSDKASLQQIMTKGDDTREFTPFEGAHANDGEKKVDEKKEKEKGDSDDNKMEEDGEDEEEEVVLTAEDKAYLQRWINPTYLSDSTIEDINAQFCENSSLQLNDFLRTDLAMRVVRGFLKRDSEEAVGHGRPQLDYALGTSSGETDGEGWQLVGPPHKRRYLLYNESSASTASGDDDADLVAADSFLSEEKKKTDGDSGSVEVGRLLDAIRRRVFRSPVFAKYLRKVTALRPVGYRDEVRRFRAGLDYTVAHYGILTKIPRLDATLCFVNNSRELERTVLGSNYQRPDADEEEVAEDEADEGDYYENLWDSGDVGGFECFIAAEEDPENAEAAEVYRSSSKKGGDSGDDDDSLLSVSPGNNVLSLVMRDEGIMKFVKYVSANAPGSRWDVTAEYEIEYSDDEDDDEDDEEDDSGSEDGSEEEEEEE